ncbi:hypothetical protein EJ04DRAFT_406875, partial [Polyplosphaeria fusca]
LLLFSLTSNAIVLISSSSFRCERDRGKSPYSGLSSDILLPFHSHSEYWDFHADPDIANRAWDAIDTNAMAVALRHNYAKKVGLGSSSPFPWDTERSIYYIKGLHNLHCLKLVRKAIVSNHSGENLTFSLNHVFHCIDSLRQDIMCAADDTPLRAAHEHRFGDGQMRRCRDWDKMVSWARQPEQHACFRWDDYREATNTLELFAFCSDDSPYKPVMEAYFDYHGHKDPYE